MASRLIPRAMVCAVSTMDPIDPNEPGAEGKSIVFTWMGFVIEITVARVS